MSLIIRLLLFSLTFLSLSLEAFGRDKGGPPPPSRTIDPPVGLVVPIDDSLVYLMIAGLFLGVFYYLKLKSKEVQND